MAKTTLGSSTPPAGTAASRHGTKAKSAKAPAPAQISADTKPPRKPAVKAARSEGAKRAPAGSGASKPSAKATVAAPNGDTAAVKPTGKKPAKAAQPAAASPEKPAKAPKARASVKRAASSGKSPAAARPWLKSYPPDVPAEIPPLAYKSVGELLVASCKKYSSRTAFTCMGATLSFAQVEQLSRKLGAYLQSRGMAKGARVALMMPNVLQYPVALMAVLRAGYVVVNVNPLYTPRELEYQLKDSGAEAIVILENFAHTLEAVRGNVPVKHVIVASMGDLLGIKGLLVNLVVRHVRKLVPAWLLPGHVKFNDAVKQGERLTFRPADAEPDDIAFLQYTGGTTGISKGAMLLNRNVAANVEQLAVWVEEAFRRKPKPADLNYICALPLYHIFALTVNALMGMQQGANNVLIPNPRDIPALVKELAKQPFHILPGLNTLFNALLNNENFRKLDFAPLVLSLGGGMAVQRPVADRWLEVTGNAITEGYGLSETSPVATANICGSQEFTGTIGLPIPSTDIAILDEAGREVPLGEVGEIAIRGPQVMKGYWNRPDETAKAMTADGYFKSGDMGFMDARGFIKIVDRKKDMIIVSGFNVYPNELEEIVATMPGVLEVAAIGVPDDKSGEAPKLFIVKRDPTLTEQQVLDYCKERLTGYKRPRYIEFRTELPKTNVGKILRRQLR